MEMDVVQNRAAPIQLSMRRIDEANHAHFDAAMIVARKAVRSEIARIFL